MVRIWVKALGGAFAASMLIGAGQLGLAYSLGLLRWDHPFEAGAQNGWNAHLTWVAFIAALTVVGGAVVGVRPLRRNRFDGLGTWIAVALAALAGAAIVVVPLVALPAGSAVVPRPLDPALNVGLVAGLGAAVGYFAALAVLSARALAANVFVTTAWVWLLALGSALAWLNGPMLPTGLRLGVLSLPRLPYGETQHLVLPVMAGMALLAAGVIAGYARWLGESRFTIVTSGVAGPALVASAYLIAGPGISADNGDQLVPWRAALVAVGAGLAASTLVALVSTRRDLGDDRRGLGGDRRGLAGDRRDPVGDQSAETQVPSKPLSVPAPRPAEVPNEDYVDWVSGLRRK